MGFFVCLVGEVVCFVLFLAQCLQHLSFPHDWGNNCSRRLMENPNSGPVGSSDWMRCHTQVAEVSKISHLLFLEKSQLTETSIFPHTESTPDQPAGQPTVHVISQYGYTNVARRWGRWAKPRPPESKYSVLIATCPVLGYRVCVNHKEVSLGLQCRSKSDQSA